MALTPAALRAQQTSSVTDSTILGLYVDTYFAYDSRRPASLDRAFTTQAARHNEFNINLAFAEVAVARPRVRGRLALQAGTSVTANYAAEPRNGAVQEATAGLRAHPRLWLDAGIFFSHMGNESWISRDNPTYTRSWVAEFSPYYESGVRATWTAPPAARLQLTLVNGWQNISETNSSKAIGVRFEYTLSPSVVFSYDNFIGNEAPDSAASRVRFFNELGLRAGTSGEVELLLLAQHGRERRGAGSGNAHWRGGVVIGRVPLSRQSAVSARVEQFSDPEQVVAVTGLPGGIRVTGASLGLDVAPVSGLLWRTEARALRFDDDVYPANPAGRSVSSDVLIVTSLTFTARGSL